MGVKEFLKPEWKKFILPAVFIVLFLFSISAFYSWGFVQNKYGCEMASTLQELQTNIEQNDALAVNQTSNKLALISENIQNEAPYQSKSLPLYSFTLIKIIDPAVPAPCELAPPGNFDSFCEFYINEETYNCFADLGKGISSLSTGGSPDTAIGTVFEPGNYKGASMATLALNVLLLFLEGYLISCVVIFAYRKFRKKKQ